MHFEKLLNSDEIILFDGAMGTSLQNINIPNGIDEKYHGCNEYLNIFAPEVIYNIHKSFLDAGADVIETNTFGANKVILSEYSLENECYKINFEAVKIAKDAAKKYGKFVAASIGPTNKLPSLKQITFDDLQDAYRQQVEAFIDASADLILIETAQDLLQVKAALYATFTTLKKHNANIYVMLSVSLQDNGYMLLGSNIDAIVSLAECFPIISLGFNCSFGPDKMINPLNELNNKWPKLISVIPNAGLPKNVDGKLIYDLSSKDFAKIIEDLCDKSFVDIVGGCCGTTPEYIKELNGIVRQYKRKGIKKIPYIGKGSSLFNISTVRQEPPPAIIAERGNVNGSKIFRNLLLNDDYNSMLQFLKKEEDYAHFLDISVAYPGRNEIDDLAKIVSLSNKNIIKPICIDSTNPDAIERALKSYAGKPIINSVHFEDGGDKLGKIFEIIEYLPAAMIGLCIDEEGMALKAEKKLDIAKRIYDKWVNFYGYKPEDLIIDPLTFSIGSGDKSLKFAGVETLNALKIIKKELPAVNTILGVSNISFGLSKNSRPYLNSVFLKEAIDAGLDMAIIDPKKIIPIANIDDEKRRLCLDLIHGEENSLTNFIKYFSDNAGYFDTKISENMSDDELIKEKILKGDKTDIEKILQRLLEKYSAIEIINEILMEAMKKVGKLFGEGKILLPFVLESAETMKMSIKYLEPYLEKKKEEKKGTLLLATVKGDVHDIGKNLVDIILSNNGYEVHNLGIKVPVEEMCKKYREIRPDAIGMSGLLVQSAYVMKENLDVFAKEGVDCKVLLGGAALTKSFVDNECSIIYPKGVYYCKDAFDAIKYLEGDKEYKRSKQIKVNGGKNNKVCSSSIKKESESLKSRNIPKPPFYGYKVIKNIKIPEIFNYLNKLTLYTARWGYLKKDMKESEYNNLLNRVAKKEFEHYKRLIIKKELIEPKVVYGYFKCKSFGNLVKVYDNKEEDVKIVIEFPRQQKEPHLSIADYFLSEKDDSYDIIAFQVVSLGEKPVEYMKSLFSKDKYKEYYMMHGLFAELTEALAEMVHKIIRIELNIENKETKYNFADYLFNMKYRGKRYSFGYPSCPNLSGNLLIGKILPLEKISVSITEDFQMVPEYTTSAFIVHNENAKYFTLR